MEQSNDRLRENRASITKLIDMFSTGDLADVHSVIASDYLDHQGLGGVELRGQQGFRQVIGAARTGLPNLQVTIEDLLAEGDKVVVRLHWHSTDPGGRIIDRETIDIVRFVNGLAVEHWGAVSWISEQLPQDQNK